MAKEIERKFLVREGDWREQSYAQLRQGYLNLDKQRTVRVRTVEEQENSSAYLTIKGITKGATRDEYEYEIPIEDAQQLLDLCEGALIEKRRYQIDVDGLTWEVDRFLADNEGLLLAEIELESEDQQFNKPDWIDKEVTDDSRYFNVNLAQHPFSQW